VKLLAGSGSVCNGSCWLLHRGLGVLLGDGGFAKGDEDDGEAEAGLGAE